MLRLKSQIRGYQWGSRDFIASVQRRPVPSPGPEAELWIGAHPDNPSTVDSRPLDRMIEADPQQLLGASSVARFGPRLPYLMKLLAAEEPLSVQAHPDPRQALEGYAAEDAAGVEKGTAQRSYVDRFHKPELLVALRDFEALCGFRPADEAAAALRDLEVPRLRPVADQLAAGALREAVAALLTWPADDREPLVAQVAQRHELAGRLCRYHPGDVGVVVALLLNHVILRPGEAVWMPAGTLHAYVHGAGVEVMASSDNVLRGGLTRKYVNVPELLRVLRFESAPPPIVSPQEVAPGVVTWPVPVPDFRLHRIMVAGTPVALDPGGPRTVLCLEGEVEAADRSGSVTLLGGEAAFGAADGGEITFSGAGEVYLTSL